MQKVQEMLGEIATGDFKAGDAASVRLGALANPFPTFVGANELADPNSVQMAVALRGRNIYAGTVPAHVKAKRRARNKAARAARRVHRR